MRIASILVASSLVVATASADVFPVDQAHSSLRVTVGLAGMTEVDGTFKKYDGAIAWDPADPTRSSVTMSIDVASIDTDTEERDTHLRSKDFFDAAQYPIARFQSARVEKLENGFRALGELSLHGVKRQVAIPFRLKSEGIDPFKNRRVTFEGHFTLKRSDFGISGPAFWGRSLSEDVVVTFVTSARIYNYQQIGSSDPASASRILTGAEDVETAFRELAARGEKPLTLRDSILAAARLMQEGKTDSSLRILQLAEKQFAADPGIAQLQGWFGRVYAADGDRERAAELFRAELQADPNDTYAAEMLRSLQKPAAP